MEDNAIDLDVSDFVDQDQAEVTTAPTESSPEEVKEDTLEEVTETPVEDEDEAPTEPTEESEDKPEETKEENEEAESPESTEQTEKPEAKNKAQNRIRTLANENRALREQVKANLDKVYQAPTVQELIDEGEEPAVAEAQALRKEIELEKFTSQVLQVTSSLREEAQEVVHEFPFFDPKSSEYDREFTNKVDELYEKASGIKRDPNTGEIYEATVYPYDFYKTFAEAREAGMQKGSIKGQDAALKNLAAAEQTSSAPPKKQEKDPFLEGFEKR